jgi:hypothetical protein
VLKTERTCRRRPRQVWIPDKPFEAISKLTWCSLPGQVPHGSQAGGKRQHPRGLGDRREAPRLSLVTALPTSVWREHLGPFLFWKDATRLRVVCKALKELVMGWPVELCQLDEWDLESALICLPASESLSIVFGDPLAPAEESRMVEFLRRHGGTLKRLLHIEDGARQLIASAVLSGALPNLTQIYLPLWDSSHRQYMSQGMLELLEDVEVELELTQQDRAEQLAALEHLRRLPHLRRI